MTILDLLVLNKGPRPLGHTLEFRNNLLSLSKIELRLERERERNRGINLTKEEDSSARVREKSHLRELHKT